MKHSLSALLLILISASLASAQASRNHNKSSNPYDSEYQRMAARSSTSGSYDLRDGTFWDQVSNANGQLGDGANTHSNTLINVQDINRDWLQVANGFAHTIAIKMDGTLWTWGDNYAGQLGDGTTIDKFIPVQVGTDNKWVSIAAGTSHTIALKNDGTLWAWGRNNKGQVGDGTTTDKTTPTQVGIDNNWMRIAGGGSYTIAIKTDGTLWTWGHNYYGQLGNGTNTNKTTPTQVGTDNKWVSIAAGSFHTMAIQSDGTLWAWGWNEHGMLGDGTTTDRNIPTEVGTDNKWVSIAGGDLHTVAIKSDGTLWAWGFNRYGQLGDGTNTDKLTPTQIGADTKWVSIAGGFSYTIGLKSDGTLWACGENSTGRLGDGTTTDRNIPTEIIGQSNVIYASTGSQAYHTAIIKADRAQVCLTGNNSDGQLGDGTTNNSTSYNCNNNICRDYALATAPSTVFTQPLAGVDNRTDFQSTCTLVASLIASGAAPATGNVTAQVFIDNETQSNNGIYYAPRHYDIAPDDNASTRTGTVTLYFLQSEFDAYNTAVGTGPHLPTAPGDASGIVNLQVTQYHGAPTGGYAPENYSDTWGGSGPAQVLIDPDDNNIVWNETDSRWEISFDVTGFSGFFVNANSNIGVPLPLSLLSFTATRTADKGNRIHWTTATETERTIFEVMRSASGNSFNALSTVAGTGGNADYTYYDEQPLSGINYYRLKITEPGGGSTYSNIALVKGMKGGSVTVAPQPASNLLTISIPYVTLHGKSAIVYDMQGRKVLSLKLDAVTTIDVSGWTSGIYGLRLPTGKSIKIIKK